MEAALLRAANNRATELERKLDAALARQGIVFQNSLKTTVTYIRTSDATYGDWGARAAAEELSAYVGGTPPENFLQEAYESAEIGTALAEAVLAQAMHGAPPELE